MEMHVIVCSTELSAQKLWMIFNGMLDDLDPDHTSTATPHYRFRNSRTKDIVYEGPIYTINTRNDEKYMFIDSPVGHEDILNSYLGNKYLAGDNFMGYLEEYANEVGIPIHNPIVIYNQSDI